MYKRPYTYRAKTKRTGKLAYILKYGVLYWGIPIAIVSPLIERFFKNAMTFNNYFNAELLGEIVGRCIINAVFIGPIFGYIYWRANHKR